MQDAANDRYPPFLLKNNVLLAQKMARWAQHERLSCQALRVCCGAGKILASLRRFWAGAARRNSSFAPHGPHNRSRIEILYCLVFAMSRAT
jgi:hypothetical protein